MPSIIDSLKGKGAAGSIIENVANEFLGFNAADVLRNQDLQREFMWDIKFPEIGQISFKGVALIDIGKFVQNVKFGNYQMESPNIIQVGAFKNKYAGTLDIQEVTMTFLRPIPDVVTPYLQRWRKLIVDDKGIYYPKINYAKNIYVYLLGTDSLISGTFKLINTFPKSLPSYDLSYEREGVLKFDISFSVDRINIF